MCIITLRFLLCRHAARLCGKQDIELMLDVFTLYPEREIVIHNPDCHSFDQSFFMCIAVIFLVRLMNMTGWMISF